MNGESAPAIARVLGIGAVSGKRLSTSTCDRIGVAMDLGLADSEEQPTTRKSAIATIIDLPALYTSARRHEAIGVVHV